MEPVCGCSNNKVHTIHVHGITSVTIAIILIVQDSDEANILASISRTVNKMDSKLSQVTSTLDQMSKRQDLLEALL